MYTGACFLALSICDYHEEKPGINSSAMRNAMASGPARSRRKLARLSCGRHPVLVGDKAAHPDVPR